jgi:hypothetical protein
MIDLGGNQVGLMADVATSCHHIFPSLPKLGASRNCGRPCVERYGGVASNKKAGGLDGSIVLIQVALEFLSWTRLVNIDKIISTKGFLDLSASDKIRLLLNSMGVTLKIPGELKALSTHTASQKQTILFGPWALTQIRNAIVHPSASNATGDSDVLYYAWRLGMWYLELSILHLCKYEGRYSNRLTASWAGQVEDVPWTPQQAKPK